jgi:hypothetical protein
MFPHLQPQNRSVFEVFPRSHEAVVELQQSGSRATAGVYARACALFVFLKTVQEGNGRESWEEVNKDVRVSGLARPESRSRSSSQEDAQGMDSFILQPRNHPLSLGLRDTAQLITQRRERDVFTVGNTVAGHLLQELHTTSTRRWQSTWRYGRVGVPSMLSKRLGMTGRNRIRAHLSSSESSDMEPGVWNSVLAQVCIRWIRHSDSSLTMASAGVRTAAFSTTQGSGRARGGTTRMFQGCGWTLDLGESFHGELDAQR